MILTEITLIASLIVFIVVKKYLKIKQLKNKILRFKYDSYLNMYNSRANDYEYSFNKPHGYYFVDRAVDRINKLINLNYKIISIYNFIICILLIKGL